MAYEVTATRKRPQDWNALVGQEFVVSTLENAIKENRIAHAYLFSGPRGVGKTSSARLLAKALNCQEGLSAHPCGKCPSCVEITNGSSVDVIEIDGASNNGVDAVREIREEVTFPPQCSRYKIYIIDEVHMLSINAFNALLKTIEEPPEYVIFIFATTELQKVPQTIRSRCQQFHFQLISQEDIVNCLKSAAADLNIEADEDALYWIAKEGAGSMRDSYTLFDQVAAFSEDHITLQKIREKLGVASGEAIADIMRLLYLGKGDEAIDALDDIFRTGTSETQLLKDITAYIRCLLFYKQGVRRAEVLAFPIQDIPEDLVNMYSKDQLETMLKAFFDLYRDMRFSLSPRFELELLISRLASIRFLVSPQSMVEKLEAIKDQISAGAIKVEKHAVPLEMPVDLKKNDGVTVETAHHEEAWCTSTVRNGDAAPFSGQSMERPAAPEPTSSVPLQYRVPEPEEQHWEPQAEAPQAAPAPQYSAPAPMQEAPRGGRGGDVNWDMIHDAARKLSEIDSFAGRQLNTKVKSKSFKDDVLSLVMETQIGADFLLKRKAEAENIFSSMLGRRITLKAEAFVPGQIKYPEEIEGLRKIFRNSEVYEIKEENIKREHKSVRNDEAAGFDRGTDENDEGGDF